MQLHGLMSSVWGTRSNYSPCREAHLNVNLRPRKNIQLGIFQAIQVGAPPEFDELV